MTTETTAAGHSMFVVPPSAGSSPPVRPKKLYPVVKIQLD